MVTKFFKSNNKELVCCLKVEEVDNSCGASRFTVTIYWLFLHLIISIVIIPKKKRKRGKGSLHHLLHRFDVSFSYILSESFVTLKLLLRPRDYKNWSNWCSYLSIESLNKIRLSQMNNTSRKKCIYNHIKILI